MLIEFGILNYKLIIPFIYSLFYQIRRIIHEDSKPLYELTTVYLGYLFAGLIYIFIRFRMKKKEVINYNKKDKSVNEKDIQILTKINAGVYSQINIEAQKKKAKKKKKKYLFILLLSLIYLLPLSLETFTTKNINLNYKTGTSFLYFIFFYVLFSRVILGYQLYNHHFFSLIIIIISMTILLVIQFIYSESYNFLNLIFNSLYFIFTISLYSLVNVLEKKYYDIYLGSPYHLMFIIGLISLVIILSYELIILMIFGVKDLFFNGIIYQIKKNIEEYSFLYIFIFIADILSAFLWIGGIHLTIYFFTPCHFIISESLSQIITSIIKNTFEKYSYTIKIIIYIFYTIVALASLIYNELIIINFGSLSVNTRKKIMLREKDERNKSLIFNDLDDNNISYMINID